MARFAEGTAVNIDRSRLEIELLVKRFGATEFAYATRENPPCAMIGFRLGNLNVKMLLPYPKREDFALTERGKTRTEAAAATAWQEDVKRRWRTLALVLKAKLAAVDDGISTVEREFLSDIVLPDGSTVSQFMAPQLRLAAEQGKMPEVLQISVSK